MHKQILEVAEGVGEFIQYWGFKKIHGKIWALVYLAERPVDAQYLIHHLGVSKALVSMSIKELLHYNVIREAKGAKSTQHYESSPDLISVILDVLVQREAKLLQKVKSSCEILKLIDPEKLKEHATQNRAEQLTSMVGSADHSLKTLITLRNFNFPSFEKSFHSPTSK